MNKTRTFFNVFRITRYYILVVYLAYISVTLASLFATKDNNFIKKMKDLNANLQCESFLANLQFENINDQCLQFYSFRDIN